MTRREALLALSVAAALIITALTLLFGPWGLLGCGVALAAVSLLAPEPADDGRDREGT